MTVQDKALKLIKLQAEVVKINSEYGEKQKKMEALKTDVLKTDNKEKALEAVMLQFKLDELKSRYQETQKDIPVLEKEIKQNSLKTENKNKPVAKKKK